MAWKPPPVEFVILRLWGLDCRSGERDRAREEDCFSQTQRYCAKCIAGEVSLERIGGIIGEDEGKVR